MAVNVTNLPVPRPGVSTPLLSAPGAIPPLPSPGDWEREGALRLLCNWSKMGFDDPIVYPGQPGRSHHHTFFGNTAINAFTTPGNIRLTGNATCRGGTINLSGYWVPSMIDTASGSPIAPAWLLVYYKSGTWQYMPDGSVLQPIPYGLRMIAGDSALHRPGNIGGFHCFNNPSGLIRTVAGYDGQSIPVFCQQGDEVRYTIPFPQCWDGVNLDSPDHKSHMAYPEMHYAGDPQRQWRCPVGFPVVLPAITYTVIYSVPAGADLSRWRLASDSADPAVPGGYTRHADWINGWDPAISDLWSITCIRERRDCGSANLGDGRTTLEFDGN